MTTLRFFRLHVLICSLPFLVGCNEIEPIEIESGTIHFYRKMDGAFNDQKNSIALSTKQVQFLEDWLNANKKGWSSYTPMGTFIPNWCIAFSALNAEFVSLCFIEKRLVLFGEGKQVEHSFSESDSGVFFENIINTMPSP
ncbi:hypothetical protein DTO96_101176 [Ephemeroptericola cinctiostellae]|uniref:Lipoprotein n=1 Tax=Ephemeroptericola cinctiostellae TaxID=2268024 RepID=A0A345DAQ7_9BURK|nr:hypothetical protein [Ephemeroptericola cinctiostellae]AXF85445.1 hypothetical protein DTO96_101176 [Ephemeroptericola cinctiostellae]